MVETVQVSKTLAVEVQTNGDPVVRIDRSNGGLVAIRPDELRPLVAALTEAAGALAEQEAARVEALTAAGRMGHQIVEARRARRKRVSDPGPARDRDRDGA